MKFGYDWLSSFRGEVVLKLWTDDDEDNDRQQSLPIL